MVLKGDIDYSFEFDYMGGNALEANYKGTFRFFPDVFPQETPEGVRHLYQFWNYSIGPDTSDILELVLLNQNMIIEPAQITVIHYHDDDNPDTSTRLYVENSNIQDAP